MAPIVEMTQCKKEIAFRKLADGTSMPVQIIRSGFYKENSIVIIKSVQILI